MKAPIRSHLAASVIGGVVVATTFLALGVTGRRTTETIIEQSPMSVRATSSAGAGLTPRAIYERDAPGVVFVRAQVIEQVPDPFNFLHQQSSISTGSGFLIDARGYLLTNYHVIAGADRRGGVTVQFEDNVARPAAVIAQDQNDDLALLKVDMHNVPAIKPLVLGDSTTVRVGDPTLAIGNPFGLDRTLTGGIVSALQRQIQAPNGFAISNVIQTDAPINPGNSGGPLLDASGKVIGINSQIETGGAGTGSIGIGFAVPINTAREFLPGLTESRVVKLAYLGLAGGSTPGPSRGVVVRSTAAGGPAAAAGLRKGDVVDSIAGRQVDTMEQITDVVNAQTPGQSVPFQIRRAGRFKKVVVLLGSRSAPVP
jgi:S1-C subfamily serine protease